MVSWVADYVHLYVCKRNLKSQSCNFSQNRAILENNTLGHTSYDIFFCDWIYSTHVKLCDVINKYVDKLHNGLLIVSVLYKESERKKGRKENHEI